MIDFHTHVLPNIDDGARDIAEANGMLELLNEQKLTHVICTPHFDPSRMPLQEFVEKRVNSISQINSSIISLIPASETMLHPYLFHYPDISELCIENTNFLLIELPCSKKWDEGIYKTIERLILYYDITPIIAHIERYPEVIRNKKTIRRFIKMGCLIQLNTTSILDKKSAKTAFQFIKKRLY
jgi:Capsular polysaccharide biosynthesis protein